ncbi:MAG: TatD family hydrolase [Chitinispirillaceae bacterium]
MSGTRPSGTEHSGTASKQTMWIDIHAHLFDFDQETLAELVRESESGGVSFVVNNSVSLQTAFTVLEQCRRFPEQLRAALGISPFDVTDQDENWAGELEKLLDDPSVIAVGEIGLDSSNPRYPSLEQQMPFFKRQLEIAKTRDLPVLVHSRGMEKRVAQLCHESGARKVVFHCFTGDSQALDYILDCGFYVSVSGIITYKNAGIRSLLPRIPPDRLFVETDTPYLAPVPKRGKQNRPGYVIHTAREAAKLLSIDSGTLQKRIEDNFRRLFRP